MGSTSSKDSFKSSHCGCSKHRFSVFFSFFTFFFFCLLFRTFLRAAVGGGLRTASNIQFHSIICQKINHGQICRVKSIAMAPKFEIQVQIIKYFSTANDFVWACGLYINWADLQKGIIKTLPTFYSTVANAACSPSSSH